MTERRVVITGMGVVSPVGTGLNLFWERLQSGVSGIDRIQKIDVDSYTSKIGGEVKDLDINQYVPPKEQRRMDPFSHYGMAAAEMAVQHADIDFSSLDPERIGVIVGTGIGGLQVLETQYRKFVETGSRKFSPFMIPQMITNIISGLIAIKYGLKGPNFCVTSACATATHSMGESLRLIRAGDADVILAGGTEAPICDLGVGGFCAMRALSTRNDEPQRASRPFDAERDGFVIAEGAGVLVLEEMEHAKKRGATMYGELAGFGATCDAYHMTAPDEEGTGAARGMKLAVQDAGLTTDDVDYINAHGTSTNLNDKCETRAIKKALGEDKARSVMISSTKSMTGHLLGAAGAVEAMACLLAMRDGIVPPTINYENPDPDCDLDYVPNEARKADVSVCLSNSLGFGGHNATLCFRKPES